jgi:Tfp pilus assembly protein PilN
VKAVNLIPSEQRRARPTGNRSGGAYVVVGLLATLLVMVAAYVVTTNRVTENQNDAAAAKAEADRLEAEAAKRASFTNFADIKQARLTSVAAVAGGRFDWERLMRELSLVMPTGSWLQSSDSSVTGDVTGSETGTTAPAEATVSQPKANLVGCTPHQPDVARMMVRMRQMYRVTDVELNQSATEVGVEEEATADSCGRYYQFDLTLTFSEAPAASEAPRGASRVPVSLGGGS